MKYSDSQFYLQLAAIFHAEHKKYQLVIMKQSHYEKRTCVIMCDLVSVLSLALLFSESQQEQQQLSGLKGHDI